MKILVNIVLFMFVSFLSAPTIVSLMADEADVSIVYSLTEEELQKELQEIKAGPESEFSISLLDGLKKATLINSENLRHENAFGDIFSPPPEMI